MGFRTLRMERLLPLRLYGPTPRVAWWRRTVFHGSRVFRRTSPVLVAGVAYALFGAPVGLKAETIADESGVTFEERFSLDGPVAPTFTRPEVTELFAAL